MSNYLYVTFTKEANSRHYLYKVPSSYKKSSFKVGEPIVVPVHIDNKLVVAYIRKFSDKNESSLPDHKLKSISGLVRLVRPENYDEDLF